jgi:hypothetical protein
LEDGISKLASADIIRDARSSANVNSGHFNFIIFLITANQVSVPS